MATNWTDDQLSAITTTGKGIIVSAAAGSGKTAVLIERTIRLLCDEENKIPADKLLAVTFTNDAASQMREKLNNALNAKIEQNPENEWFMLQQMKLQMAKISTINSFCLELVKNNIHQFDISSGVRILDETEYFVMQEKAIEIVLEKNYSEKPDMMKFLNNCFCVGNDKKLIDILKELYKFSRSLPFKESWFDNALESFDENSKIFGEWERIVLENIYSKLLAAKNIYVETNRLASALSYHSATKEIIHNDYIYFETAEKVINSGEWDSIFSELKKIKFSRFSSKADKNAPDSQIENEVIEKIKKQRNQYKELLNELSEALWYSRQQIKEDMTQSKEVLSNLIILLNDLWDELWEQKVQKNAIDFNDVELLSIKLLCEETENGYKKTQLAKDVVSNQDYQIILIDEFQDVNNLQDLIFKMLSDTDNDKIIGRNMFVVGDVKQSIYRFRQANPNIFIQTRLDANKNENKEVLKEIKLKKNFRSRSCVVDFVNFVFENIMTDKVGEVYYNIDEALDCGADYNKKNYKTEILVINQKNEDNDDDDDSADIDEPAIVANKIRQMLDMGYPVYENGTERPCRQSDFCLLLRSKTVNKEYIEAFKNAGLSAQSEELTGYLRSREISILISMLQVIDNPMNDIALVAVLLSPIFMFTADDVAVIKNASEFKKLYPAFIGISGEIDDELIKKINLDDNALTEKCKKVVSILKELRFYSASLTLEQLISKIYISTDFFSLASTYKDGTQKRANLRLFLEYANSYDKSIGGGLTGFIRYIESVFSNGGDLKQAGVLNNSSDSVSIKTIHKSKGLEYPFVFLCKTSTKFTMQKADLYKPVLINLYKGIGFKLQDIKKLSKYTTLPYDAIKSVNEIEMLSEEMRLLYVAMTRAKERLFVTYKINEELSSRINKIALDIARSGGVTPELVKTAASMQDWLTMALLVYENNSYLRNLCEENINIPLKKSDADIVFSELKVEDFNASKKQMPLNEDFVANIDESIVDEIERYINFSYDIRLSETQSKLSVSEIAKQDTSLEFFYQIPRLNDEIGKLTAAEIGTATHAFMEHASYPNAELDVLEEINRLIGIGLLSKKQGNSIDIGSVEAFFNSDFYKRIKNSDNVVRERQFLVMISDLKLDDELLLKYNGTEGMLQGIADCIFEEDDGFVLVDYKTDNVKSVSELTEHYTLQLKLYKAAFDLILDKPVKSSYIYSFKLKKGIEIIL